MHIQYLHRSIQIMVSRKKNKGKERKAKKEENKKAERHSRWERFARGEDENNRKVIHCDHGCTVEIPDSLDHPVVCFMDEFFAKSTGAWFHPLNSHTKLWSNDLFNSHTKVWSNDNYRNMAVDLLLRIGANFLLERYSTSADATSIDIADVDIACTIVVLENYNETKSANEVIHSHGVSAKVRDIGGGNMRDAFKFYSKRLSCACLKIMYSDARKNLPKQGFCHHCHVLKERASLSVCSRCRVQHYCSRECQVAEWPEHETCCDEHVRIHKQQTK